MISDNNISLRKITVTAMLSALSTVLLFLSFKLPFLPSNLSMELSDLPSLIASFAFGPIYGVAVCAVKCAINLASTKTGGIGELANFLLGGTFAFVAGIIYYHMKTKKGAVISSFTAALSMGAIAFPVNYYILLPVYANLFGGMEKVLKLYTAVFPSVNTSWKAALLVHVPFTLSKGVICAVVTLFIYKRISPFLKGKGRMK